MSDMLPTFSSLLFAITIFTLGHEEMYFTDGSNPPEDILERFLMKAEDTAGAIAVHCKAGLGRTGCVIGAYLMKHYQFTAEEMIGWFRIVRPGSIIGPQQQWMQEMQMRMWHDGEVFRANLANNNRRLAGNGGGEGASLPGISKSNIKASPIVGSHKNMSTSGVSTTASAPNAATVSNPNGVNDVTSRLRTVSLGDRPNSRSSNNTPTINQNSPTPSSSSLSSSPVPSYSLFNKNGSGKDGQNVMS